MATVKSDSQTEAAGADHQEAEGRALHALLASAKAGITVRDEFRHLLKFLPEGSNIDFDDVKTRLLAARVSSFADVGDTSFPAALDLLQAWETEAERLSRVEQLLSKTSSPKLPGHHIRCLLYTSWIRHAAGWIFPRRLKQSARWQRSGHRRTGS